MCVFAAALGSTTSHAETLKVAIVSRTVFFAPLWIAKERGFFKDRGIDVEITVYDNAEKINADLKANLVQIAMGVPEPVILESFKAGTMRIIAGNAEQLPHFIIAKPEIKSIADLKGKTIGVLSLYEGTTNVLPKIVATAGLTRNDYKVESVGGAPTRWRLLKEGKIDAGLQPFPLSYEADAAGFTNLGPISKIVPNYQFSTINIDDRWGRLNRPLVVGFLAALQKGQNDMSADPAFASQVAARELRTSVELANRALQDTSQLKILSQDLSVSQPGMQNVFAALIASGAVSADMHMDMKSIVDESYLIESRK